MFMDSMVRMELGFYNDRLQSINAAIGDKTLLVLHGADPFDEHIFQRCIKAGVSRAKIIKRA